MIPGDACPRQKQKRYAKWDHKKMDGWSDAIRPLHHRVNPKRLMIQYSFTFIELDVNVT